MLHSGILQEIGRTAHQELADASRCLLDSAFIADPQEGNRCWRGADHCVFAKALEAMVFWISRHDRAKAHW